MIKSLSPDLVIAFRGNPLRTLERLKKLGLPVFVLNIGNDLDSLFPLLDKIGRVTHRERKRRRSPRDLGTGWTLFATILAP